MVAQGAFIITAELSVLGVSVQFPRRDGHGKLHGMVLFGAVVADQVGDASIDRFLVRDVGAFGGKGIGALDLVQRLKLVEKEVIEPRQRLASNGGALFPSAVCVLLACRGCGGLGGGGAR